jgi:septal ring factor EnvC (AmiA/AmiB activator)
MPLRSLQSCKKRYTPTAQRGTLFAGQALPGLQLSAKEKALSQLEKEALKSSSLVDEVTADIVRNGSYILFSSWSRNQPSCIVQTNASARCDELSGRMKKLSSEAEKRGAEITGLEAEIADLESKLDDLEHKVTFTAVCRQQLIQLTI